MRATGQGGAEMPNDQQILGFPGVSRSLVICALPRTGSTLLAEHLHRAGTLGQPREAFLQAVFSLRKGHWPQQFDLARIVAGGLTPATGVFGVKLMSSYAGEVAQLVTGRQDIEDERGVQLVLGEFFAGSRFVYLTRENRLDHAVSRIFNRATGKAHRISEPDRAGPFKGSDMAADYNKHVPFSFAGIESEFEKIAAEEAWWERFFDLTGQEPVRLTYERITSERRHVVQIAEQMGVGVNPDCLEVPAALQVVRNTYSRAHKAAYRAIAEQGGDARALHEREIEVLKTLPEVPEDWRVYQIARSLRRAGRDEAALDLLTRNAAHAEGFAAMAKMAARLRWERRNRTEAPPSVRRIGRAGPAKPPQNVGDDDQGVL